MSRSVGTETYEERQARLATIPGTAQYNAAHPDAPVELSYTEVTPDGQRIQHGTDVRAPLDPTVSDYGGQMRAAQTRQNAAAFLADRATRSAGAPFARGRGNIGQYDLNASQLPNNPGNASMWLANYLLGQSRIGNETSAAEVERQNAFESAMRNQQALAVSNPAMNPALAGRVAAGNIADLQQQGVRQSTLLRAQEEEAQRRYSLDAIQAAMGGVGQAGQYSLGRGQLDLGNRELQQRAYDNEQQRAADEERWRAELAAARAAGDKEREAQAENNLISAIFGVVGMATGAGVTQLMRS